MNEYHIHNGIDAPRINPIDLLGFPIFLQTPTHTAEEGTFVTVNLNPVVEVYLKMNRVWNLIGRSPASLSNTVALNFGAIAPHSSADLTMALTGAVDGDSVILGVANAVFGGTNCTNIVFFAWVSATDVVTVRCLNNDAVNTANPANGNFTVKIMKL